MNLERRILQSLRPRREGVLLRSDVNHFGSASQVSVALKSLLGKGLIAKLDRGVFAKPEKLLQCGAATLQKQAQVKKQKQSHRLILEFQLIGEVIIGGRFFSFRYHCSNCNLLTFFHEGKSFTCKGI